MTLSKPDCYEKSILQTILRGAKILKRLYLSLQASYGPSDTCFEASVFQHFIQFLGAKTLPSNIPLVRITDGEEFSH